MLLFSLFYNQRKLSNTFWHSSKGMFTPFIDRCFVVLCGFSYYSNAVLLWKLKIIRYHSQCLQGRISTSNCFSQIHPILWKDSQCWHTSGEPVDLWHHYLILLHLLCPVDWCLGVLPGAPSHGWTRGSYTPPLHISITQRGSEHCYNAEKLIMFISASCWGPQVWRGPGLNWATLHEMEP